MNKHLNKQIEKLVFGYLFGKAEKNEEAFTKAKQEAQEVHKMLTKSGEGYIEYLLRKKILKGMEHKMLAQITAEISERKVGSESIVGYVIGTLNSRRPADERAFLRMLKVYNFNQRPGDFIELISTSNILKPVEICYMNRCYRFSNQEF